MIFIVVLVILLIGIGLAAFFLFSSTPEPEYYNLSGCEPEPATLSCGDKVIQSATIKYG
jgi:flagellar basal body-associated protein FliL